MNLVVAIATSGRRDVLSATIRQLAKQTRLPDYLYICPAAAADVDPACLQSFPAPSEIVQGPNGSSHQRNAIVRHAISAELIAFFDDDFLADPKYLEEAEQLFSSEVELVVATGHVLADGAQGPGLAVSEGLAILDRAPALADNIAPSPSYSGYGCNMVIRIGIARANGVEFDEQLPLYGWWEDVDFCRRMARFGRILRFDRMRGVHLGSKSGKTHGKRLGYSQVANLLYMKSKGSISRRMAFKKISFNVAANLARSFFPEPWVDRRGRLRGNFIAFIDLCRGNLSPQNAKDL